ncbi:MAG: RagB/SusD family nutrient uptake outer membrane protein [Bergeyella sp.]
MRKLKIIPFLLLAGVLTNCGDDFLNPEPTSAISADTFYSTESELMNGVINMYDGIQGVNALNNTDSDLNHAIQVEYFVTEMRSDNTQTKSGAGEGEQVQFENHIIKPTNSIVYDYYRSFYDILNRANIVLKNLGVASDANRAKIEGEAKFVRAYAHFNLVRLFGDIPLADEVITIDNTEKQFTRVPKAEVYNLIISDLETAVASLDNTYKNRASKAAAQALLAKVYLTLGTNYLKAQQLCEAVMSSGFSLQSNFHDVFYTENNSEIIFAIGYLSNPATESQGFSAEWLNSIGRSRGVNYVTNDAAAALDSKGGSRTTTSYRVDPAQTSQKQVAKYFPNGEDGGSTGVVFTLTPRAAGNDWIVLRYADVLLMHVEAIMAGGDSTSVPAALNSFQLIRNRAGLTTPVTSISKEELLDERRVELAFENQRFFDLVRFGVAQEVLSAYSAANGGSFTSTDLLLPIPQREINLSQGKMQQNPGY